MVFTIMNCWANDSGESDEEINRGAVNRESNISRIDPISPLYVPSSPRNVSNGYYGYSYIHNGSELNNNISNIINNNYNDNNNINNNNHHHLNNDPNNNESHNNHMHNRNYEVKNDVNGSNIIMKEDEQSNGQYVITTAAATTLVCATVTPVIASSGMPLSLASAAPGIRCLKRSAATHEQQKSSGHDFGLHTMQHPQPQISLQAENFAGNSNCSAAKRVRISADTDEYSAAQYCNDFFYSLGSNNCNNEQNRASQSMDVDMSPASEEMNHQQNGFINHSQQPEEMQQVPQQTSSQSVSPTANLCYQDISKDSFDLTCQSYNEISSSVGSFGRQSNHTKNQEQRIQSLNLKQTYRNTSDTVTDIPYICTHINIKSDISSSSSNEECIKTNQIISSDLYEMYASLHGGCIHNAIVDIEKLSKT